MNPDPIGLNLFCLKARGVHSLYIFKNQPVATGYSATDLQLLQLDWTGLDFRALELMSKSWLHVVVLTVVKLQHT